MLAFDMETVGQTEGELAPETLAFLTKNPEKAAENIERTSLSPYTGYVACVALWDTAADKGVVLMHTPDGASPFPEGAKSFVEGDVTFKVYPDEATMLVKFWGICTRQTNGFLSYNGRGFDIPFAVIRSAALNIPMCRKLIRANRYYDDHIDIKDCLENYGSFRAPANFDLLCRTLGIPSPKEGDVKGAEVGAAWRAGRYMDVARYCMRDVRALVLCAERLDGVFGNVKPTESTEPAEAPAEPDPEGKVSP